MFKAIAAIALAACLCLAAAASSAERRVALVIGNDNYAHLPKLNNALRDARDMAAMLRRLNFEVFAFFNGSERKMNRAINRFGSQLQYAEVGLVFYAGHGIQANGENYLIPVSANLTDEADLATDALSAGRLLEVMRRARNPLNIVILDACRDNPLPRGSRSATRGLAVTQSDQIPDGARGTAIVYAAGPGQKSADGAPGGNGLFTKQLLRHMNKPGWSFTKIIGHTIEDVRKTSGGKQVPWSLSSVTGDFVLRPLTEAAKVPAETSKPRNSDDPSIAVYNAIRTSTDIQMFETFLNTYPDSVMAPFAKLKISQLQKTKTAAVVVPKKAAKVIKSDLKPVNANYVILRNANVRAEPSRDSTRVTTLGKNTVVYVPAKTTDGKWYQVKKASKVLGYVYRSLLQDQGKYKQAVVAARKLEDNRKRLQQEARRRETERLAQDKKRREIEQARREENRRKKAEKRQRDLEAEKRQRNQEPEKQLRGITAEQAYNTALNYSNGRNGYSRDYQQAAKYYRHAANLGHARAQYNLALFYRKGRGVKQNHAETIRLYKLAIAQGHSGSMNNMGFMYENGYGVPQDVKMATYWYRRAASYGHSLAKSNLERIGQ